MLTQSISNSLLKEFARKRSEISYVETDKVNQSKSNGIKREVKSPQFNSNEYDYDGPPLKTLRTNEFDLNKYIHTTGTESSPSDNEHLNTENSQSTSIPSPNEVLIRNYSDIMRNLAAKYSANSSAEQLPFVNNGTNHVQPVETPKPKFVPSPPSYENPFLLDTAINPMSFLTGLSGMFPQMLDMSSTRALITLSKISKEAEMQRLVKGKQSNPIMFPSPINVPVIKDQILTSPLDLSPRSANKVLNRSPVKIRNYRTNEVSDKTNVLTNLLCSQINQLSESKKSKQCQSHHSEVYSWTVDQVCDFVKSIDICAEYVQVFKDQSIDGTGLTALTEEHLTRLLGMKLGPALKLTRVLRHKISTCCDCSKCLKFRMSNDLSEPQKS